ncbi:hypothetical protein MMC17_002641 [Xylographa soralifera]|nr:hypothetical protein [Xylographa soralifera]
MKRLTGLLNRQKSSTDGDIANGDSPEASIARGVRLFCESGAPNNSVSFPALARKGRKSLRYYQGEEVLHLPVIVDSAESSPAAAKEAANVIRKFLSKENFMRAYVQYNAIMLVRILAENPGKTFTKNLDGKFVVTTKELLRDGRDMSVQQILRETLDEFQIQKSQDETLQPLITMWQNEKAKMAKRGGNPNTQPIPRQMNAPPFNPNQPYNPSDFNPNNANYFSRNHSRSRGLPPPHELASRIEEAKTSGKLLQQVVQSTPPNEILGNELIKEFSERCQSASRSIQGYINSDNPAPDEDTLLTLIETNDQLSMAMSKHQRAMLQARKVTGQITPDPPTVPPRDAPPQNTYPFPPQDPYLPTSRPPQAPDAQIVPPPGPPPRLAMPQRQEPFDNPFDDNNHTTAPPGTNGTSALAPSSAPSGAQPSAYKAYNPAYQAAPNYANRQDSSLAMHGAAVEDDEAESPDDTRRPVQYRF